jgi:hypothetical protein
LRFGTARPLDPLLPPLLRGEALPTLPPPLLAGAELPPLLPDDPDEADPPLEVAVPTEPDPEGGVRPWASATVGTPNPSATMTATNV